MAVPELVRQLRLVEQPCPVRYVVPGPGRAQRALGPHQRGRRRPDLAEHRVPARLGRVQERLHHRRRAGADALLRDAGQLHGLPAVAEVHRLPHMVTSTYEPYGRSPAACARRSACTKYRWASPCAAMSYEVQPASRVRSAAAENSRRPVLSP